MKVQAGRKYITRRGDIVEVKYIAGGGGHSDAGEGIFYCAEIQPYRSEEIVGHWGRDGVFLGGIVVIRDPRAENRHDIIAEINDR